MKNIKFLLVLLTLAISNHSWAQTPPSAWGTWTEYAVGHPSYTPPPCARTSGAHFIVNSAEVWDQTLLTDEYYVIKQTIRVVQGGSLTIDEGVALQFVEGTGIIVEVGASLIIGDASHAVTTLTSFCPNGWNGIEVKGSSSDPQFPTSLQGVVTVDNAAISYANVAIQQAGGCAGEGGGIITANNTVFENNVNGITFAEYQAYTSESKISDCQFEINDGFQRFELIYPLPQNPSHPTRTESDWSLLNLETGDASQITIKENNGLVISGCRFYNYFSADAAGVAHSLPSGTPPAGLSSYPSLLLWAEPEWLGSAIVATESQFEVDAIDLCEGSEVRNEFEGWYYGVYSHFSNPGGYEVKVSGSDFTDNTVGVQIANCDVVYIDENNFDVTNEIWQRYIVVNENLENGVGAFNQSAIKIIHNIDDLYIRGNDFDINLEYNFAAHTSVSYHLDGGQIPEELVIQDNSFRARIENRPTGSNLPPVLSPKDGGSGTTVYGVPTAQTIGRIYGLSFINWSHNTDNDHEFFLDCNEFDLFEDGVSYMYNKHYYRYDIQILKGGSTSPSIEFKSMGATGSNPLNTFSDYSGGYGCMTGTGASVNYYAYHIGTNMFLDYPVHASVPSTQLPSCTTSIVAGTTGTEVSTPTATVVRATCTPSSCGTYASSALPPAPMNLPVESSNETSLHLFPNPATDAIMVDSDIAGTYKVMSLDGRVVIQSSQLHTGQNQIDISQLRTGEYILHFIGDTSTEVHKFVKE